MIYITYSIDNMFDIEFICDNGNYHKKCIISVLLLK